MNKLLVLLLLASCSQPNKQNTLNERDEPTQIDLYETITDQKKVELKIHDYLMQNLDNPKSYEPVSFDTLTFMTETYKVWADRVPNSIYFMHHQYRATNEYNALILIEGIFFLDSNLTIIRQMKL